MYGLKKKDEVKLLKESYEKSDSEEPVLKQEDISIMESVIIDCSQNSVSTIKTSWKPSLNVSWVQKSPVMYSCSYRDLLIIKQDGNPWKLAKPSFNIKL